jgi:hypothetical protein
LRDFVELEDIQPLILEVIEKGGEFRLYPRGISMEPLLHAGDDSVMLGEVGEINVGDVLFYRRTNGDFVLHRLIEKRGDTLTMCGDHQMALEFGILPSQVFAKMVGYYKKDVYHSVDEPEYLEYAKKMTARFPFYRRIPAIYKAIISFEQTINKGQILEFVTPKGNFADILLGNIDKRKRMVYDICNKIDRQVKYV